MVIIDAGHGGNDPGAQAFGVKEKDWALEVSLYQYHRLKELGVPVKLTRDRDMTLSPSKRSSIVKNSGMNYCISNHFNAGGGSGCETIYSIFSNDRLAKAIADAIAEKGMPFRRVFSKEGSDGRDYYFMHRLTGKVRTIIVEYGFLDNEGDFKRLNTKEKRETYAEAVVQVLCNWLGKPYDKNNYGDQENQALYRVQVGAFRDQSNAERLIKRLKEDGYSALIIKV